jgi:hypothetical protein
MLKYVHSELPIQYIKYVCIGAFDQSSQGRWRQDLLPQRVWSRKSRSTRPQRPLTHPHQQGEDSNPSPILQAKKTVLKAAKDIGLPFTILNTGGFPEYDFIPYVPVRARSTICPVLLIIFVQSDRVQLC